MRTVVIMREPSTDEGTFGHCVVDNGRSFYSGELPWRNNLRGISCIPSGSYLCQWLKSPAHGMCYHVTGVKGRSEIEIHLGNWAGDKQLGKKCDIRGCIVLGRKLGKLDGQRAVIESGAALEEFQNDLNQEDFQLVIHDAPALDLGGEIAI